MKNYVSLILSSIALIAVVALTATHFEYRGPSTIVFAAIALLLGYQFGRWTCHLHSRAQGFWITVIIFALLNLLHSMIDGASIGGVASFASGVAVLTHELARQPALYVVLWGMLTPFTLHTRLRVLIVLLAVTGVWVLGAFMGYQVFVHIQHAVWLEPLADVAVFLFLGDIIHHIREEVQKLTRPHTCCHD